MSVKSPLEMFYRWERETPDGVVHTVYASVPGSYDPTRAWPARSW